MKKPNSGFILPSIGTLYAIGAVALVILGLGIALRVQTTRLHDTKVEKERIELQFKGFVSETQRLGDEALKDAAIKTALGKSKQEKANEENVRTIADLRAGHKRLRDEANARGSYLPTPGPEARSPESITFDRAELDRALRDHTQEVRGLVEEGDEARVNLDTAKTWGQK